jgi:hypothetical protein
LDGLLVLLLLVFDIVCVVIKVVCLCLYKWIVVRTRVPRLHSTAITWDNWSQTQKMRAEKILKLMPMVDGNQLGPEAWL